MKLLFDENLSPRLVAALVAEFHGSAHANDVGLGGTSVGTFSLKANPVRGVGARDVPHVRKNTS